MRRNEDNAPKRTMVRYQKNLMLAFVVTAICALVFASALSTAELVRNMRTDFINSGDNQAKESLNTVNDMFRDLRYAYNYLESIPSVNAFLYQKNDDYLSVSRTDLVVQQFYTSQDYIHSMHLYNRDTKEIISFGNVNVNREQFFEEKLKSPIIEGSLNLVYSEIRENGTSPLERSLSILFGVDKEDDLGQSSCMIMTLDKDAVENKALMNHEGITIMADATGEVIFQTSGTTPIDSVKEIMELCQSKSRKDDSIQKSITFQGERYYAIVAQSTVSGLYLVNLQPEKQLNRAISMLIIQTIGLLIMAIAVIVGSSYILSIKFYSPIRRVIELVKDIPSVENEGTESIGALYDWVKLILLRVDTLENHQQSIRLEQADNQIRSLLAGQRADKECIMYNPMLKNISNVFLICIRIDKYEDYNPNERIALEKTVCTMIPDLIRKEADCHAVDMTEGEIALFYSFVNKEQNSFAELIENMSDLQKEFQEKLKISVTIGIGGIANSLEECITYYDRAKDMANYRFLYGRGEIFYPHKIEDMVDSDMSGYPIELEEKLIDAIRKNNREEFEKTLNSIISQIRSYIYQKVIAILIQLIAECIKTMNYITQNENMKYDLGIARLVNIFHSEEIIENVGIWMMRLFDEYREVLIRIRKIKDNRYYHVTEQAKTYIENHYMELDLSVEVIARECGYSSYYFSRIFKELVGMNPVEYIKQIRIREAKRRLEEQNIKVTDVAELVGYSNASNFYSTFKKMVGMTPSEYKEFISKK